jgi:hypothetical protein
MTVNTVATATKENNQSGTMPLSAWIGSRRPQFRPEFPTPRRFRCVDRVQIARRNPQPGLAIRVPVEPPNPGNRECWPARGRGEGMESFDRLSQPIQFLL